MRFTNYLSILFLFSNTAVLGKPSASQIIAKGEKTMRGQSTQAMMEMTIKRPSYTRQLTLRSWTDRDDRALVEILYPQKEEGVSSLRVKDKMWNFLPKVNQTVRVPTSLMLQSWMGSDFTNDDLMKASSILRDYHHKIVRQEVIAGEKTTLVECRPKKGAAVVWGKIHYWARIGDSLPVMQKYFDEEGNWVRTIRFSNFKKMDDRVIPAKIEVQMAEEKDSGTTVEYKKVIYDRKIAQLIFDKDRLQQTSQEGKNVNDGWSLTPLKTRSVASTPGKSRKRR